MGTTLRPSRVANRLQGHEGDLANERRLDGMQPSDYSERRTRPSGWLSDLALHDALDQRQTRAIAAPDQIGIARDLLAQRFTNDTNNVLLRKELWPAERRARSLRDCEEGLY
jgi:hypothetical protein